MACSCKKNTGSKYKWTGDDGSVVVYDSIMAAKAKVIRKGGSFEPVPAKV